jgi:hypothetical protein
MACFGTTSDLCTPGSKTVQIIYEKDFKTKVGVFPNDNLTRTFSGSGKAPNLVATYLTVTVLDNVSKTTKTLYANGCASAPGITCPI